MRYAYFLDPYLINNVIIKYIVVCSNVYEVRITNIKFFVHLSKLACEAIFAFSNSPIPAAFDLSKFACVSTSLICLSLSNL